MKKYVLGILAVIVVALAYPVIGFYMPPEEPVPAPRTETTSLDNFCTDAQKFVSETNLTAENRFYTEFSKFTASKPGIDENSFIISQHVLYDQTPAGEKYAKLVSCKFKSSDRIQIVRGEDAAGEEKSCKDINQQTVNSVLARLSLENPPAIILEEDEIEEMGSNWVKPWPYEAVKQDADGTLRIRAHGMPIKYMWYHFMPERFLGVQYCHLVAPDYVEALVTGRVSVN